MKIQKKIPQNLKFSREKLNVGDIVFYADGLTLLVLKKQSRAQPSLVAKISYMEFDCFVFLASSFVGMWKQGEIVKVRDYWLSGCECFYLD